MRLSAGSRLGPYEIVASIGAGGMGEVYRARDTALQRDVAIKVLPEPLSDDPDRLARFEREARTLAALNHPNIAQVYGLETSGQTQAIVLELVEGPTLEEIIAAGPPEAESDRSRLRDGDGAAGRGGGAPRGLTMDDALPIARQIAEALDAAHQAGIVHRDLKPANIKVREDGTVKVLDFGLAKAVGPEPASGGTDSDSPTLTARATQMGMILGTAAYMAPEQAKGKAVDERADIWAFGVVLYEMVTGTRLFAGDDLTETLASVVKDTPDLSAVPREIRRLLDRCLRKDPRERLRDIGDAWALLDEPSVGEPGPGGSTAAPSRLPWIAATLAGLAAVVLAVLHFTGTVVPPESSRFRVTLPPGSHTMGGNFVALSPDGRHLALVLEGRVWVRSLDVIEAVPLEGTDDASYPFWSPDSTEIGFFTNDQLQVIGRTGGLVRTVAPASSGRGATWNADGTIVFSADSGQQGLRAVDAQGGEVRPVTTFVRSGGADAHRYPSFLPDGERFLYLYLTADPEVRGVYVGSLDGSEPVRVLEGADQAVYAPPAGPGGPGHLLFRRGEVLMAQAFDAASLTWRGAPAPVVDGVGEAQNTGSAAFSASLNGHLAFAPSRFTNTELVWFDRDGTRLDALTDRTALDSFALSRDGQRAAVAIYENELQVDVWLQDPGVGSPSRFTFAQGPGGWMMPLWSPDGRWVAYNTYDLAGLPAYEIRRKPTDMSGAEETLLQADTGPHLWDWAPDGSYLVYDRADDLFILPLEGDRTPVPFLETPADEEFGQVSPDGRWMAYTSDEQGEDQVYVRSIPATGSLWQISTTGGTMPRWRRDGRELYYRAADGTLMAVAVRASRPGAAAATFEYVPAPTPLFDGVPSYGNIARHTYQPSSDGQRFAMITPAPGASSLITVVLNWEMAARGQ